MSFSSITIQGNILSSDILQKIRQEDIRFQQPGDFGLERNSAIRDEIGMAWASLQAHWKAFNMRRERLSDDQSGTTETRNAWMLPFFRELGYELEGARAEIINEKSYAISHRDTRRESFPVHIVGINQSLDKRSDGGARLSPHALVQEYLNNSEHLYALTSNGQFLRLLRDATRLSRLSYLEFDLQRMMEEELYAEFALLYRLLHASRMPARLDAGAESIIEYYHQEALASGSRIRGALSQAVELSIKKLANGILHHPANTDLREQVQKGEIKAEDYYLYTLRLVYRMLFLMVIEERKLIFPSQLDDKQQHHQSIYFKFYSLQRLCKLAEQSIYVDGRKSDLWKSLLSTFALFEASKYGEKLSIAPLGSGLFSMNAIGPFHVQQLDNENLLLVLRYLVTFENEQKQRVRVNYADLDVEEFGSVYEGLLEYAPVFESINGQPEFRFKAGDARSSSGSHYTPEELVKPLIKHSLDYLIEDKLKEAKELAALEWPAIKDKISNKAVTQKIVDFAQTAEIIQWWKNQHVLTRQFLIGYNSLLTLSVCDVACGSGHILLSAARRIGIDLAILQESSDARSNVEQPSPSYLRHAVRDAIKHCIYGVDKNPLAVELCKVALWLEAHEPGQPLNFLDHRIKCGDAIVGLAHADELNRGIPTEAFKSLPGDDKDMASAFRKQNEVELKNKGQLGAFEMTSVDDGLKNIQSLFTQFAQLPENTPDEIATKERAYTKLKSDSRMNRLRNLADLQIAQFFIPKTTANRDKLTTHSQYYTYLSQGSQILDRGASLAIAFEKRFFHWFLEFPTVFEKGGFDCVLGNPPFLGNRKLSGTFGDPFLEAVKYQFSPIGAVDLVTYFFRRIFTIIKSSGFQSLISTNTISQGNAREDGLGIIVQQGGKINHAVKSMKWPGQAAVEVALVTITKQPWKGQFILNGNQVKNITAYLDDTEALGNPISLKCNEEKSFQGSIVLGKGFVLEPHQANDLIQINSIYKEVVLPYLNGEDLNNSPSQSPSRWVINFFDWTEPKARKYTDCFDIIERLVKPERQRWATDQNGNEILGEYALRKPLPEKWWMYADKRPALYRTISNFKRVLVVPRVTKYPTMTFVNSKAVFHDKVVVLSYEKYWEFSVLQSSFHDEWAKKYSSTLGGLNNLNYSPSECLETFPFPQNIKEEQQLATIGEAYHEHRRQLMLCMQLGLTKTYNLFHSKGITLQEIDEKDKQVQALRKHLEKTPDTIMFEDSIQGILKLRQIHVEMDKAVLEAYGWHKDTEKWGKAIALRHDFYEVDYLPENDRVRYTIHPEARKEVLKRLLLLNHERYEEEIKQGLHKIADVEKFYADKGQTVPPEVRLLMGSKGKEKKPTTKKKPQMDGGLFGEGGM